MLGCAEGEHIRHIDEWLAHFDDVLGQKVIAEGERVRRGERLEETISEYSVSLPDGSPRWFEARAKPVIEEDGTIVTLVGTDTDITERKKIEQDLLVAKDAAEKANRAKSEFLATMSHEFRTPLNAILGFSELMRSGALGPIQNPAFEEYLGDIHRSGMHMLALVNDVLDIAAIEAGKRTIARQPLNITDLFETTVRSAQSLPGGDALSFDIDTPPDLPELYADERAIVQVFNNLLSNAVKFTDAGGEIRLRAHADAGQFILSVADTGHGIPAEKLHVVTQPFSQVSTNPHVAEHSTGLGLAIVKSLVDFHDGELRIESEPGVGTDVSIILPLGSNGSASA